MTDSKSTVATVKQRDGKWSFALTFRGVSYPAQGGFSSQLQAHAAGAAALRALESRKG
jgi:hypothetical protein